MRSLAIFTLAWSLAACGGSVTLEDEGRGDGAGGAGASSSSVTTSPAATVGPSTVGPAVGPAAVSGVGSGGDDTVGTGGAFEGFGGFGGSPLTSDFLDYTQVYLAGTVEEGSCGRDAIAHLSEPDAGVTGFDCYFDGETAQIRPFDGRLLYQNTFEYAVHEFHCDACPYAGTYPEAPLANDPTLSLAPCVASDVEQPRFLVSPLGDVVHSCGLGGAWYDEDGVEVYDDGGIDPLVHLGIDGLALTNTAVVDLVQGTYTPIEGLPSSSIVAARAFEGPTFLVAVYDGVGVDQLWQIDASGLATVVGTYPPPPPGVGQVFPFSTRMDIRANLFQIAYGDEPFRDLVIRREPDGASDVVYDEIDEPLVRIHISSLVTGP